MAAAPFDTDVIVRIPVGGPTFVGHAQEIPLHEQSVPIVVIEEIFRGRLNAILQAESWKSRIGIERAYQLFDRSFRVLRRVRTLTCTTAAESLFRG